MKHIVFNYQDKLKIFEALKEYRSGSYKSCLLQYNVFIKTNHLI